MSLRSRSTVSYLAMAALLIALALTGMSGCGSGSSSGSSSSGSGSGSQTAAPSIASFTAASSTITAGGSTTLSWSVTGATSLSIDNSVGTVTGTSVSVTPSATTTYTLTATNAAGTPVTAQVTVTVVAAPSIASFTATPSLLNPVTLGTTTATLSWSVAGASTVSIDNSIGAETGSSVSVTPSATTTYTLTATNAAGSSVTAAATVSVRNKLAVLAGVPNPGADLDGTSTTASFDVPTGIAMDASGNLYVVDTGDNQIRKVTPEGVVTTIASGAALTTGTNAVRGHVASAQVEKKLSALEGDTASSRLTRQALSRELRHESRSSHPESLSSLITHAGLNDPEGIAVSSDGGTIYVADTENQIIRKIIIASDGTASMSTFAGTLGTSGSADGTGTAASFDYPNGIVLDASGNLYVADSGNSEIRKISPGGVVTTFVNGAAGFINSTNYSLYPVGITIDISGNLYITDSATEGIYKITSAGVVSALAGGTGLWGSTDGTGTAASFEFPEGITVDASGTVYVADTDNSTIRKITPEGVVTTLAGKAGYWGNTDGTGTGALLGGPSGIVRDASGNLYVTQSSWDTIRKITIPAAVVTTFAGSIDDTYGSTDGTGTAASFHWPEGIAVDANGNLYIADSDNSTIRKITPVGVVTTFAGTSGTTGSTDGTGAAALFDNPQGIAVDASGNVYVADTGNSTIRKITPEGVVTTLAGTGWVTFYFPEGIAVDASGTVYVADTNDSTIRKITPEGVVTTLAGKAWTCGSADGTGTAATFDYPEGIAVDANGNLYIADSDNSTIRKITPEGVVTTLAGKAGTYGSADGTGTAATFDYPKGITVDASGNVYVADKNNSEIRKITPEGVVTTIIGAHDNPTTSLGLLPASIFNPYAVAVDSTGNLYITVPNAVLTLEP
jgi:sugar lactone lactonase YvrE